MSGSVVFNKPLPLGCQPQWTTVLPRLTRNDPDAQIGYSSLTLRALVSSTILCKAELRAALPQNWGISELSPTPNEGMRNFEIKIRDPDSFPHDLNLAHLLFPPGAPCRRNLN